jgi:5-oxoprolinase (ATP-hydrolysing) subunit A
MDLNSDLGEGFGAWAMADDANMLKLVTSASVACGFHAGDPSIMRARCVEAASRGVAIGAHVGYGDLAGFGRRYVDYSATELADTVLYQLAALDGIARSAGSAVGYVKPHGALYDVAFVDPVQAGAVVAAIRAYGGNLPVLCLPGSELSRCAESAGLRAVPEAFADRAYTPAGRLVPRREPGAVLVDPTEVKQRALRLAQDDEVIAIDGTRVAVAAESLCVHGDTSGAVTLVDAIRDAFAEAGIMLAPFVPERVTVAANP